MSKRTKAKIKAFILKTITWFSAVCALCIVSGGVEYMTLDSLILLFVCIVWVLLFAIANGFME